MNEPREQEQKKPMFAIVELFGHQKIAGAVGEQNFGGAHFVRVDVPEVTITEHRYEGSERIAAKRLIEAHTRSFGGGAIYSINWCDETTARIAAQSIQHEPLRPYSVKTALEGMAEADRNRLLSFDDEASDDDQPF